jgi:site-specific DNA-cytosine methylase
MTLAVEQSRLLGSEIVGSLNAVDYKWPQNQQLDENKFIVEPYVKSKRPQTSTDDETWVANQPNPTLNAFDQGDTRTTTVIVEDPVLMRQREGKPGGGKGPLLSNDKSLTLSGSNDQTLFQPAEDPIVFENSYRDAARIAEDGITQTLTSKMGTGGGKTPMVAQSVNYSFDTQFGSNAEVYEDKAPPLKASQQSPSIAFTTEQTPKYNEDVALTLTKGSPSGGGQPQAVAYDEYNDTIGGEVHHALRAGTKQSTGVMIGESVVAPSLTASNDPSRSPQSAEITQQVTAIHQATMAVRRLTPLECERLMGWPDGWTATKADGTPQSDTHRYKQCGNGVASPVAQWIAQQLLKLNTP